MKNVINKIVSSSIAIIIFLIVTPVLIFLLNLALRFAFGGTIDNTAGFTMVNTMDWILTIVAVLLALAVSVVASLYRYYHERERGYADSHVKVSHRDW